jgi:hypothetical protein
MVLKFFNRQPGIHDDRPVLFLNYPFSSRSYSSWMSPLLFQYIFDGYKTGGASIFINYYGYMHPLSLEFLKQFLKVFRLRNKIKCG